MKGKVKIHNYLPNVEVVKICCSTSNTYNKIWASFSMKSNTS